MDQFCCLMSALMGLKGTVRQNELETGQAALYPRRVTKCAPFRYFKTSPEIIRLAVMLDVRFPLSLRNVEDLLHERGIDISHATVRFWWNRFGPMFVEDHCRPIFSPQPFQSGAPLLLTRQFQAQSNRCSC